MISKEKQILKESYDRRNQNVKNTVKLMDKMLNYKLNALKRSRTEQYDNHIQEFKSKGETFDTDKLGHTQNSLYTSPTSKSNVRPFKPQTLHEARMEKDERELQEIIEWLDQ